MHPASIFHTHTVATLIARLREHPFALFAVNGAEGPLIAHAPALINNAGTELRFHLSRNNAMVPILAGATYVRIIATGAHAYISPDWYGLDDQVPTWNYESVEAKGVASVLDTEATVALLDDVSSAFESRLLPKPPWTRHKMGDGVFDRMVNGIVGYRVEVETLTGITKLNQNKPEAARRGVILALGVDHPIAISMAETLK